MARLPAGAVELADHSRHQPLLVSHEEPTTMLRNDAIQIWRAGVDAVRSERLLPQWLRVEGQSLLIGNDAIPLQSVRRIVVVGAGKAGAGMAEAVEAVFGTQLMAEKQLAGWVNVPADCVRRLQRIHLHAARPTGVNEPTAEGVVGTNEILRRVGSLGPDDLCLCLISGGGSALMPAPVEGITLADKLAITRHLSAAGANIEQLNAVRKQLSRVKGGGLLRACRAGRLVSLILSDVLGDPLDLIASGPTVPDASSPQAALTVLNRFGAREAGVASAVFAYLENQCAYVRKSTSSDDETATPGNRVTNLIIGNNATAVDAAATEAARLGYSVAATSAAHSEGPAEEIGRQLAEAAIKMRAGSGPTCLISGGEPVVALVEASRRGLGGRNQQLVLAAAVALLADGANGMALLSGGTDGEDGPTDAAGALFDADVLTAAKHLALSPADFLARNDAYHFFDRLGALVRAGPTHTNVCDLRIVVVQEKEKSPTEMPTRASAGDRGCLSSAKP